MYVNFHQPHWVPAGWQNLREELRNPHCCVQLNFGALFWLRFKHICICVCTKYQMSSTPQHPMLGWLILKMVYLILLLVVHDKTRHVDILISKNKSFWSKCTLKFKVHSPGRPKNQIGCNHSTCRWNNTNYRSLPWFVCFTLKKENTYMRHFLGRKGRNNHETNPNFSTTTNHWRNPSAPPLFFLGRTMPVNQTCGSVPLMKGTPQNVLKHKQLSHDTLKNWTNIFAISVMIANHTTVC